jgi:hypothetical protein
MLVTVMVLLSFMSSRVSNGLVDDDVLMPFIGSYIPPWASVTRLRECLEPPDTAVLPKLQAEHTKHLVENFVALCFLTLTPPLNPH